MDTQQTEPGAVVIDDLSEVLQHIAPRAYRKTRAKVANSPETRQFLDLGLEILRADLLEHEGPDMEEGEHSRIFGSVSRERLLRRAAESSDPKVRFLTENQFRYRWPHKNEYTEDLIAYLFRPEPYNAHLDMMAAAANDMTRQLSLGQLIEKLAAVELDAVLANVRVSLITVLQASLPNHPRVREYAARYWYANVLDRWSGIYEQVCNAYGLHLQPGVTWEDLAVLFNSVIDGVTLRARTEGAVPTTSSNQPVLTAAIFAMVPSLLDLDGRDPYEITAIATHGESLPSSARR
ncbi:hypothetical protein ACQP1P_35350 [Dactylosporangium sp. CA-052675]|uniref:hypothetical protein n=1 Tax=Dactylosporangium sp. CA-052675 TaxID=3239927 RepID=UPI003D89D0F8